MNNSAHLVENFEVSFQNCFSAVTAQNYYNVGDTEEVKSSVEQNIHKFLDVARQLETFFLQKRQLLCLHSPEQVLKEEISDLKAELTRKDHLIQRHHDKLQQWQTMLSRTHTGSQPPQQSQVAAQAGQGQQSTGSGQTSAAVTIPQTVTSVSHSAAVQHQAAVAAAAGLQSLQGPLAYLEQTTSNIGLPERR